MDSEKVPLPLPRIPNGFFLFSSTAIPSDQSDDDNDDCRDIRAAIGGGRRRPQPRRILQRGERDEVNIGLRYYPIARISANRNFILYFGRRRKGLYRQTAPLTVTPVTMTVYVATV